MAARADPVDPDVAPHVRRQLLHRHQPAPRHAAGELRLVVAEQDDCGCANARRRRRSAHRRETRSPFARCSVTPLPSSSKPVQRASSWIASGLERAHRIDQHAVQVGAMDHEIRRAVARDRLRAEVEQLPGLAACSRAGFPCRPARTRRCAARLRARARTARARRSPKSARPRRARRAAAPARRPRPRGRRAAARARPSARRCPRRRSGCAMRSPSFRRPPQAEPGVHNHRICGDARPVTSAQLWLWIPRFAGYAAPGMTPMPDAHTPARARRLFGDRRPAAAEAAGRRAASCSGPS